MKVALIGSTGLVGSAIKKELKKRDVDSLFLTHCEFDITNSNDFEKIKKFKANTVINASAFLGVDPCEKEPIKAFSINAQAVNNLVNFCDKYSIALAQISTNNVFDGKASLYDENSTPNPIEMYGATKYIAEQFVKEKLKKYYIFRLPILFGPRENKGNIFIEKMYNLYLNGNKHLKVATDVINSPSYSIDVAKKIVDIILDVDDFGIYHILNKSGEVSLHKFVSEFFSLKNITDITIEKVKSDYFKKDEMTKKPLNISLKSIKIKPLRDWREAMSEYIKEGL